MTYARLLTAAPAHDTPEFLEYLRTHNVVIHEDDEWLVIQNAKYHQPDRAWFTAFIKHSPWDGRIDLMPLVIKFGHLVWLKKSPDKQTVKRWHIHLYEPK